jgi:DNA-binding NarL/FixJ family response regulator
VLVLGDGGAEEMIDAVEAGAMGYLAADASFDSITDTVRSLAKGVATVEPALLGALLRHVVDRRRVESQARRVLEVLTPREHEVFALLAQGSDSGRIADRLFISVQTVRTHTRTVMSKLDLHSRSELVALAARCGFPLESGEET